MKWPGKFDKKMWAVFLATEGGFALDKQLEEGGCSRQEEKWVKPEERYSHL